MARARPTTSAFGASGGLQSSRSVGVSQRLGAGRHLDVSPRFVVSFVTLSREANMDLSQTTRQVFDRERRRNARRLANVRLAGAILVSVLVMIQPFATTTRGAAIVYAVVGLALFLGSRFGRSLTHHFVWAVPFIDIPTVSVTQNLRLSQSHDVRQLLLDAVAINLGFLVLSSLSLNASVVATTAFMGATATLLIAYRIGLDLRTLDFVAVSFGAASLILWWLTRRTLPLVVELHRQEWLGHYKLGRRLGAGGMAEVFEASMRRSDGSTRRVAIKRVLPALAGRAELLELFRRETELAVLMAHPNIVQVLDAGADDEGPFLVMEFVDGVTLSKMLSEARSRNEPISPNACLCLADQLLQALAHVQSRVDSEGKALGLMHRDLNPPNILVTRQGELKLSDFGIAKGERMSALTTTGIMRGKAGYAAPEQILGAPLTQRIDLFALGIVLAEVALGEYPFEGETEEELTAAQLQGRIAPLNWTARGFPAQFERLVRSLLEPTPERRCSSAQEALDLLRTMKWNGAEGRLEVSRLARGESLANQPTVKKAVGLTH